LQVCNTLLLASPAKTVAGRLDDDGIEAVEPSAELDVESLVEDEIILVLPYSPRHSEGVCRPSRRLAPGQQRGTAFATLAVLKRNRN